MPLEKDFVQRLNIAIIISFVLFVFFFGIYFFISFNSEINAIETTIQGIVNQNLISSITTNLGEAMFLFMTQLITFSLAIIALLVGLWYTTQKYLVEKKNALIDPLTELYNRKSVFFSLKRELRKTERFGHPTTVAMIDIDKFKSYNDTLGHIAGDRLLRKFSKIIAHTVRKYDIFGRYGGEEFIIVFPETKVEAAYKVCERLRKAVEDTKFYGEEKLPHKNVTISIGLAEIKGKKVRKETLIHNADQKLYKAKTTGRNQVLYK